MAEKEFINNLDLRQYELHLDEYVATAEYEVREDGVVHMIHTEVPSALKGKGVGSELIASSLKDIREQGKTVFPECPFVTAYIKRHPEWIPLVKAKKKGR